MESFLTRKLDLLSLTDPDRIYVENIRSIFNLPTKVAKFLCEVAVRSGEFEKMYGIKCPNCGRTIKVSAEVKNLPKTFTCTVCEALEEETCVFDTADSMIFTFYRLKR
jgi:predicted RNA-binding Zn-ribbon protein involved in translation (DUF1610 family)